jgi:hypothetical protein
LAVILVEFSPKLNKVDAIEGHTQMDSRLFFLWRQLNDEFFDGELSPVSDVGWHPLSGAENLEAFGIYMHRHNAIALDGRFKPDSALYRAGDEAEEAKGEVAWRLLLHEMIHQAQYQRQLERPGGHGASFVAVATQIAEKLGEAPPTEATASRWPELGPLLVHYGL